MSSTEDNAFLAGVGLKAVGLEGQEEAVTDMLTNRMHYCDHNDQSFEYHLDQARKHYVEKKQAELEE